MAKKKARKEIKQEFNGKIEIYGILLILVAIIGCCKFKPASDIINGFSGFLVGVLWAVLLVIIGFIGAYMIVKRKKPDLLTSKLIGLYIVLMGFLSLFHLGYIRGLETQGITYGNIIEATFNNLNNFIDGAMDIQGGGMIGALISVSLVKILGIAGSTVVSIAIIICGLIMFTGITIYDVITALKNGVKSTVKKTSDLSHQVKNKDIIKKIEHEYENDTQAVISNKTEPDYKAEAKEEYKESYKEAYKEK